MEVPDQAPLANREHAWLLAAVLRDVEKWRREVAAVARQLGAGSDARDVARLGVTELIGNVHKHVGAGAECRLVVETEGEALCVRLFDTSREVPRVVAPGPFSEGGRGLWLLREMADDIGYTLTPEGKWVWITCALNAEESPGARTGRAPEQSLSMRDARWPRWSQG